MTVASLDEPQGWRQLHATAQKERDPQRLALLIDELNSLLERHEKMQEEKLAADENSSASVSMDSDKFLNLDIKAWQYDA
jgi:hypothetical protein